MEILTDFSPSHLRYAYADRLTDSLTFAPLSHHLASYRGRINLIMCTDDTILVEQTSPSTIALTVLHAGPDLVENVASYARLLERDVQVELLPEDADSPHRSLLYLPQYIAAPKEYSLSHGFARQTALGATLPQEQVEWSRTFALNADGDLVTDTSITVSKNRPPIHPGLDRILTRLFPPS